MDGWEKFNEVKYGRHYKCWSQTCKSVFKNFNNKNISDYHELHVQSDTLLLAYVFENFKNKCIGIYELNNAHFLFTTALTWQACFKKRG